MNIFDLLNNNPKLSNSFDLEVGKEYTYKFEKVVLKRVGVHYSLKNKKGFFSRKVETSTSLFVVLGNRSSIFSVDMEEFLNNTIEAYSHKEELNKILKK